MKRLSFSTLGALVLGCVLVQHAYAQFGSEPAKLSVVKLQDDLVVIHNEFVPGNTTALITNQGVILVDDKFEIDHDNIIKMLKTVTNQPVKYVINTHHHADHSGGNAKLQAEGTLAVASVNARARMIEGKQSGLPDITVQPRGALYLGGKTVEIYWLGRGHTDGDVVAIVDDTGVLFAGDLVEQSGPPAFGDDSYPLDWPEAVAEILHAEPRLIVPGHGAPVDTGFVAAQHARLAEFAWLIREGHADGATPDAVAARAPWPAEACRTGVERGFLSLDAP